MRICGFQVIDREDGVVIVGRWKKLWSTSVARTSPARSRLLNGGNLTFDGIKNLGPNNS